MGHCLAHWVELKRTGVRIRAHSPLLCHSPLKNRNALPDLPHTAFPLERLFPGTNWTLNPSCQSLFPGLFQHSGLRGHRWAAWKSFRDAEHTVAVGHWTLAFFLKCQNPDFYCKTCSLQYSMSVSSRQESL